MVAHNPTLHISSVGIDRPKKWWISEIVHFFLVAKYEVKFTDCVYQSALNWVMKRNVLRVRCITSIQYDRDLSRHENK